VAPFDREGALKRAEKALRQGRVDAAIEEYLRIIEAQPRDWNSANALGDLYVRSGQTDKGVAQYTRIAEHLAEEGFFPKAAALYKKILKVRPDDERTLIQLADLSARQGLLADAKATLTMVAERRRVKGDRKGAAEMQVRIGTLDPDDLPARIGAARAAVEMGDVATALREYRSAADDLEARDRLPEALEALAEIVRLDPADEATRTRLLDTYLEQSDFVRAQGLARGADELKRVAMALDAAGRADEALAVFERLVEQRPGDVEVRARLAGAYARKGDLAATRRHLSPATAGDDPVLWMQLAELDLRDGKVDDGRAAVSRALELDRTQREAAVALACRIAETEPEAAYPAVEVVADAAVAEQDFAAAAAALHEFVTRVRHHIVALMRLVEICVDGGLEATMASAQAQLADAYLEAGRPLEARIISEDLVAREPWDRANIERFRRALVMLGEKDPDAIIADRLSGDSPFLATDKLDLNEGITFEDVEEPAPVAAPPAAPAKGKAKGEKARPEPAPAPAPIEEEVAVEIDLSDDLSAGLGGEAAVEAVRTAVPARKRGSLEDAFTSVREEADRQPSEELAAEQYRLALTYRDMGMLDEAMAALEIAARAPRQRFDAASLLGRLHLERSQPAKAAAWFEKAAEAPAPTADAGRALLYDLARTLEQVGEQARALVVYVELEADAAGYRDVSSRIERLSRVQAQG
jgi:tetratricopeptide (TPR) repeat protein